MHVICLFALFVSYLNTYIYICIFTFMQINYSDRIRIITNRSKWRGMINSIKWMSGSGRRTRLNTPNFYLFASIIIYCNLMSIMLSIIISWGILNLIFDTRANFQTDGKQSIRLYFLCDSNTSTIVERLKTD